MNVPSSNMLQAPRRGGTAPMIQITQSSSDGHGIIDVDDVPETPTSALATPTRRWSISSADTSISHSDPFECAAGRVSPDGAHAEIGPPPDEDGFPAMAVVDEFKRSHRRHMSELSKSALPVLFPTRRHSSADLGQATAPGSQSSSPLASPAVSMTESDYDDPRADGRGHGRRRSGISAAAILSALSRKAKSAATHIAESSHHHPSLPHGRKKVERPPLRRSFVVRSRDGSMVVGRPAPTPYPGQPTSPPCILEPHESPAVFLEPEAMSPRDNPHDDPRTTPEPPMVIDSYMFPHLIQSVMQYCDYATLLVWRQTSHAMLDYADTLRAKHILVTPNGIVDSHGVVFTDWRLTVKHGQAALDGPENRAPALFSNTLAVDCYLPVPPGPLPWGGTLGPVLGAGNLQVLRVYPGFSSRLPETDHVPPTLAVFTSLMRRLPGAPLHAVVPPVPEGTRKVVINVKFAYSERQPAIGRLDDFLHPESLDEVVILWSSARVPSAPGAPDSPGDDRSPDFSSVPGHSLVLDHLVSMVSAHLPRIKYTLVNVDDTRQWDPDWLWPPRAITPTAQRVKLRWRMIKEIRRLGALNYWPDGSVLRNLSFPTLDEYRARMGDEAFAWECTA